MERNVGRLAQTDLTRLRDAVREAQRPGRSIPRREILAVHGAAPVDAGLTVDLGASEALGMPLLVLRVPADAQPSVALRNLTPRELEVAELVTFGLANKEIAERLRVQTSTVKEHVHRILTKTGLPSRAAIARAYLGPGDADGAPASATERE